MMNPAPGQFPPYGNPHSGGGAPHDHGAHPQGSHPAQGPQGYAYGHGAASYGNPGYGGAGYGNAPGYGAGYAPYAYLAQAGQGNGQSLQATDDSRGYEPPETSPKITPQFVLRVT